MHRSLHTVLVGVNPLYRTVLLEVPLTNCRYGLVPNGGRLYYTRRSQPPLLTQMVELYYNATGNVSFLEGVLPYLVREHQFWMENRSVEVGAHSLNHYAAATTEPR